MEKLNNWKYKFFTIWAGQAVSLITSAIVGVGVEFHFGTFSYRTFLIVEGL